MIGRLPLAELGLGFAESCAPLATPGNPTDKEPTTAVARKSRRETVINPSRKQTLENVRQNNTRAGCGADTAVRVPAPPLLNWKSYVHPRYEPHKIRGGAHAFSRAKTPKFDPVPA